MKIIDNINTNHNKSILKMISNADKIILASPFLTEEFEEFINDIAKLGVRTISLITTIKDNSPDLSKKANSLYSLCKACMLNNINFEVMVDNKLHGKIYIGFKDGSPTSGIITSANFTDNGLSYSHEWGVEIDDSNILQSIIDDLIKVSTEPITYKEIEAIVKTIDDFYKVNPIVNEQKLKLDVTKHIKDKMKVEIPKTQSSSELQSDVRYFLKPLGTTDQKFEELRPLSNNIQEIHFSRRRPASVRIGDILICYGVGISKILGYFRVITEPFLLLDDNTRWPWAIKAENLCPKYSANWASYNNTILNIKESYGEDKELTFVGGKSLGALNFGADKIRLNEYFAEYIINIIESEK